MYDGTHGLPPASPFPESHSFIHSFTQVNINNKVTHCLAHSGSLASASDIGSWLSQVQPHIFGDPQPGGREGSEDPLLGGGRGQEAARGWVEACGQPTLQELSPTPSFTRSSPSRALDQNFPFKKSIFKAPSLPSRGEGLACKYLSLLVELGPSLTAASRAAPGPLLTELPAHCAAGGPWGWDRLAAQAAGLGPEVGWPCTHTSKTGSS